MSAQPFKVLVVDDDRNIRDLLKVLLESQGYNVKCAGSVDEALALARNGAFDVVLTDQQLPGPNGPELLGGSKIISQLRATKPHLPVILMTAATGLSVEAAVELFKLGAFGYIFKPCRPRKVLHAISKAVTASRAMSKPVQVAEAVATRECMKLPPFRVLIVEDDNLLASVLKKELESLGYAVDCAESVHEGLARAKHEDFDVVLTDLWLPDPSDLKSPGGLKTVSRLRAIKPHLPVIVMSGSDSEIESIKLGAYGYIEKPIWLPELLEVLGEAVTARRVVSKAADPGEAVTAEDTLVQKRDKDCTRSTIPAPVRGEPGSANKKVARALTASRVMQAGGRMECVRQLLLRIVKRLHNRLVRSSSIIEGQKELGRYRMLMSGLRHDATNFLADIVAGVEALRRLQGKQSEGTVDQRFDRVAENLRSTCEGLQKMIRDFTVDLRPSSTNRPQRTPISVPESSGPTGPAPITAGPLFEEARDLFRYLSEAQSIQIKCDPAVDTQFLGHSQLLRVLAILIQNAAEAIGTNGTITLRARRAKAHLKGTRTEAVILDVEDTGPGIPAEVQERLFHPFFSTKSHGIGLGLATAAWIVAENGGAIQFKTRLGHGTTFTVILPACEKS